MYTMLTRVQECVPPCKNVCTNGLRVGIGCLFAQVPSPAYLIRLKR